LPFHIIPGTHRAFRRCAFSLATYTTAYLDESGNSGPNLEDVAQPIYTLVGILTPGDGDALTARILNQAAQETNLVLGPDPKGKNLLKPDRERGWRFASRLFDLVGESGCVPFWVLAEKRYVIGAKIVETFLDPVDNPSAPVPFDTNVDPRQEVAYALSRMSEATLFGFSRALRERDRGGLARSLENILAELPAVALVHLRAAFEAMRGAEQRLVDDLLRVDKSGPGMKSLNLPVFVDMVTNIEMFARVMNSRDICIVHDESKEFAPVLESAYKQLRDSPPAVIELSNGNVLAAGFTALRRLEFGTSTGSTGIQIADILAAAIRIATTATLRGEPLCDEARKLAAKLLTFALLPEPKLASVIISDRFATDVVGPLVNTVLSPTK
jgi:hypothetical protein